MSITATLPAVVRRQDAKIQACLAETAPQTFWYAQCPLAGGPAEQFALLGQQKFDNYPVADLPALAALQPYLFFFERVLGSTLQVVDGQPGDFFHTWCEPLLREPEAIDRCAYDLAASPLWGQAESAIRDYVGHTPAEERLPLLFPGVSPLDIACNLCGTERFFLLLYEHPDAADRLLGSITELLIEAYHRVQHLGARVTTSYGFPGIYCNDLQMPYLSPPLIARFVLPCYARLAAACGGVTFALLCTDLDILRTALGMDGLIACAFDKRLPLPLIRQHLGRTIFLLQHYQFDDTLDRPTWRDGVYYNPIVQCYSRELSAVYQAFAGQAHLAISIERPSLAAVCATREHLQQQHRRKGGGSDVVTR